MQCPQCGSEIATVTVIKSEFIYFDVFSVDSKEVIVREDGDAVFTVVVTHDDGSECQFHAGKFPNFVRTLFDSVGGECA